MYLTFGILGALSGPIMAAGDILLDLKGKDDREIGKLGIIHSAWDHMARWRFPASILLALVGCPMQMLGFTAMAHVLSQHSPGYGLAFWLVALAGTSGAFFIHTILCLFPVICQFLGEKNLEGEREPLIGRIYEAVKIPFWIQYFCLVLVTGVMIIAALFMGLLPISPWYGLLTAPVLTILGLTLRKLKPSLFYDLPGIVMPSLGVGAVGLLAVISML